MSKKKKNRPLPESFALPLVGVDSHAHLNLSAFTEDLPEVLARAKASGVSHIGNVFMGTEAYNKEASLFTCDGQDMAEVFFLLGVHPNESQACTEEELLAMKEAFQNDSRLRAIGEIGLDYYWHDCPHDVQDKAFRAQLDLAKELNVPVVIHSRDATEATIKVLEEEGYAGRPLLWHCFGSEWAVASRLLDNGWHISIPGTVTYSANEEVRKAVRCIPLDRLMIETDAPFLTAEPYRGSVMNQHIQFLRLSALQKSVKWK